LLVCVGRVADSAGKHLQQGVVVAVESGVGDQPLEGGEGGGEESIGLADCCGGLLTVVFGDAKLGLAGGEAAGGRLRGPVGFGLLGAGCGVTRGGGGDEVVGQGALADGAGVAGAAGLGGVGGGVGPLDGGEGVLRSRQAGGGLLCEGLRCGDCCSQRVDPASGIGGIGAGSGSLPCLVAGGVQLSARLFQSIRRVVGLLGELLSSGLCGLVLLAEPGRLRLVAGQLVCEALDGLGLAVAVGCFGGEGGQLLTQPSKSGGRGGEAADPFAGLLGALEGAGQRVGLGVQLGPAAGELALLLVQACGEVGEGGELVGGVG
jgi:hypothetical protein